MAREYESAKQAERRIDTAVNAEKQANELRKYEAQKITAWFAHEPLPEPPPAGNQEEDWF